MLCFGKESEREDMCQSKAEGGRRCASSLRSADLARFSTADSWWVAPPHRERNEPAAILADFGDSVGAAALNLTRWAVQQEPSVTPDLARSVPAGWSTEKLECRIKAPESIARKLQDELALGRTMRQAEKRINDALRYSIVAPSPVGFASGIQHTLDHLMAVGYTITSLVNLFQQGARYMGYHATANGEHIPFEIQFHTRDSFTIKQTTDATYAVMRAATTPRDQKDELAQQMALASSAIVVPDGLRDLTAGQTTTKTPDRVIRRRTSS